MAQDNGRLGGVFVVKNVEIGAADAGRSHGQEDLTRAGTWHRHLCAARPAPLLAPSSPPPAWRSCWFPFASHNVRRAGVATKTVCRWPLGRRSAESSATLCADLEMRRVRLPGNAAVPPLPRPAPPRRGWDSGTNGARDIVAEAALSLRPPGAADETVEQEGRAHAQISLHLDQVAVLVRQDPRAVRVREEQVVELRQEARWRRGVFCWPGSIRQIEELLALRSPKNTQLRPQRFQDRFQCLADRTTSARRR